MFVLNNIHNYVFLDFDDDGTLDYGDLEKLVNCLTGETADTRLSSEEMRQLISNVSSLLFGGVMRKSGALKHVSLSWYTEASLDLLFI